MGYIFKFLAFNIGQYIGVSLTISDLLVFVLDLLISIQMKLKKVFPYYYKV